MSTRTTRTLATALAGASLAWAAFAPPASADLLSERTAPPPPAASQDLRSPDTRDVSGQVTREVSSAPAPRDLRSPDTRDVATGYSPAYDPAPSTIGTPSADGFDWLSAAIGGAAIGGVLLVLFAVGTRRPQRHGPRPIGA